MGPNIARGIVVLGGLLLALLGILHDVLGAAALRRAVSRGEVSEALAGAHMVNWVFSGAAMSLLGILAVVAAMALRSEGRLARRIIVIVGLFFTALGVAAFAWEHRPAVLVFAVLGLMLCLPPLLLRPPAPVK